MATPSPSRRDLMEVVTALLGSSVFVPLAACSSDNKGKTGTANTGTTHDGTTEPVPPPQFDAAALSDAIGLALAAMPVDTDVDALLTGAQEQIDTLHEAGLVETAAWVTTALDDVVTETMGAFGAAFPANGPLSAEDSKAIADDLVAAISSGSATLSAGLAAATAELRDTIGSDTVSPLPEVAAELAESEVEIRQWMHAFDVGEGGLSSQSGALGMLHKLQQSRAQNSVEQSLSTTSDTLQAALDIFAEAEGAARRMAGRTPSTGGRSAWRAFAEGRPPAPPDALTDFCDVYSSITFVVDLALSFRSLFRAGAGAMSDAGQRFYEMLAELPDEAAYLTERYWRWVADDIGEEVVAQATDKLKAQAQGEVVSELSEQECDTIAAFLLTVFFIIDFVLWMIAFVAAISWVATLLGATPSGGLIALVIVLLLLVIIYFVLQMVCAVVTLKPSLDTLAGNCSP